VEVLRDGIVAFILLSLSMFRRMLVAFVMMITIPLFHWLGPSCVLISGVFGCKISCNLVTSRCRSTFKHVSTVTGFCLLRVLH
jgi:hypothetical protein